MGRKLSFDKSWYELISRSVSGHSYFVISLSYSVRVLRDTILPPFTSKVVRYFVEVSKIFSSLRNILRQKYRLAPISISPLFIGNEPLFKSIDDHRLISIRKGYALSFRIGIACSKPDFSIDLSNSWDILSTPYGDFEIRLANAFATSIDSLSIGLSGNHDFVKIRFMTPTLLSSKLMTPPIDRIVRRVRRFPSKHILLPRPSYIFNYLVKLWNTLFPTKPIYLSENVEWASYFFGRICDIHISEIDHKIKPITVLYDITKKGRPKKPRGFIGWIIYEIHNRKIIEKIDKLLALANILGIGRSRTIGFGQTKATKIEKGQ